MRRTTACGARPPSPPPPSPPPLPPLAARRRAPAISRTGSTAFFRVDTLVHQWCRVPPWEPLESQRSRWSSPLQWGATPSRASAVAGRLTPGRMEHTAGGPALLRRRTHAVPQHVCLPAPAPRRSVWRPADAPLGSPAAGARLLRWSAHPREGPGGCRSRAEGGSRGVQCTVCPIRLGALKQTTDGMEWVHVVRARPPSPPPLRRTRRAAER